MLINGGNRMNNKTLFIIILLLFGLTAYAASAEHSFSDCLRDCSEYFSSQTVSLSSVNLTTKRQILGLNKENLCQYKEIVSSDNSVYTVNCKFTKTQRKSLAKILDEFDKNPENDKMDFNDFSQVQSSSVYEAWSNYLQDPSVCEITTN